MVPRKSGVAGCSFAYLEGSALIKIRQETEIMARQRFCKVCGGWHALDVPWPAACWRERGMARSSLAAPIIIGDGMQPVRSMLDGKIYDSKRALRATYKAAGVTEVGNDVAMTRPQRKPDRKGVKAAVSRAFSRAGLGA